MDGPAKFKIAVVAESEGDRLWLLGLLSAEFYQPLSFSSLSQLSKSNQSISCIVHCIRKPSLDAEHYSHIPNVKPAQLVVISDVTSESFVVSALESGARNVININESSRVLRARIDASFRDNTRFMHQVHIPPYLFDASDQTVSRRGQFLSITPIEYRFARYMFEHLDREVSIRELMTAVWSSGSSAYSRRVDTIASRVRAKLELKEQNGWLLRKNPGAGFILSSCTAPWCLSATMGQLIVKTPLTPKIRHSVAE